MIFVILTIFDGTFNGFTLMFLILLPIFRIVVQFYQSWKSSTLEEDSTYDPEEETSYNLKEYPSFDLAAILISGVDRMYNLIAR